MRHHQDSLSNCFQVKIDFALTLHRLQSDLVPKSQGCSQIQICKCVSRSRCHSSSLPTWSPTSMKRIYKANSTWSKLMHQCPRHPGSNDVATASTSPTTLPKKAKIEKNTRNSLKTSWLRQASKAQRTLATQEWPRTALHIFWTRQCYRPRHAFFITWMGKHCLTETRSAWWKSPVLVSSTMKRRAKSGSAKKIILTMHS